MRGREKRTISLRCVHKCTIETLLQISACTTKASINSIVHHYTSVHHSVSQCSSIVYFKDL